MQDLYLSGCSYTFKCPDSISIKILLEERLISSQRYNRMQELQASILVLSKACEQIFMQKYTITDLINHKIQT